MGGRLLFGLLAIPGLVGGCLAPGLAGAEPIAINAVPVRLSTEDRDRNSVGQLLYRGGLHLRADDRRFGGLSALGISADGRRLVALSDSGHRFSARLEYDRSGNLAGLHDANFGSLSGLDGRSLSSKADGDAESMAPGVDGEIIVAFERRHRLWRYRPGITVPEPLPEPVEMSDLPFNNGVEALTLLADGSLLAFSEGKRDRDAVVGWISDRNGWSVSSAVGAASGAEPTPGRSGPTSPRTRDASRLTRRPSGGATRSLRDRSREAR